MHTQPGNTWSEISAGFALEAHRLTLSTAANERYWAAAGLDDDLLDAGAAYPLIAANCTVLAWNATCDTPVIQTRQGLRSWAAASTPIELRTTGSILERTQRRGREYVTIVAEIAMNSESAGTNTALWSSTVEFTPAASTGAAPAARPSQRAEPFARLAGETVRFTITDEHIRRYSRRGNYHSDADTAEQLGLPGLVAQGTQVCGPAYGLLLRRWGTAFLDGGDFDARFVGMVLGGDDIEATVAFDGATARFEVWNSSRDRLAAIGTAGIPTEG